MLPVKVPMTLRAFTPSKLSISIGKDFSPGKAWRFLAPTTWRSFSPYALNSPPGRTSRHSISRT